eukprot:CAMPEP_0115072122 /NCGR_PEP_ID=MMETSP0227-20121206/14050_1 /TAXON_ID=89957 /ORGANISM="Polarella glacialis, Strain CCMP 1383" /LENGTH=68 /DNA_ID=CAMNT_0002458825 /DNA_START=117 /DNA_END=320 /DNA_ORIENTATION=-
MALLKSHAASKNVGKPTLRDCSWYWWRWRHRRSQQTLASLTDLSPTFDAEVACWTLAAVPGAGTTTST